MVANVNKIPYAIESLMISVRFSSIVAFVLQKKMFTESNFEGFKTEVGQKKKQAYRTLPPPNKGSNFVVELVPVPNVRSTNNVVNSP